MTGSEALRAAVARLAAAGVPEAAGDARRLLAHAIGVVPGRLTLVLPDEMAAGAVEAFDALVARRVARVPVGQLVGRRAFWGREFRVTADVLDPRPETEVLVAEALTRPFARVVDLGTGTGCILITLLAERPGAEGVGVDLSEAALAVAEGNARDLRVAARFRRSDWWAGVEGVFDLIVSNPPYIAAVEMAGLEPEVRDHEPAMALTDRGDGLGAFRAILAGAAAHLAPGGRVLLEIGPTQGAAVIALAAAAGLPGGRVVQDWDGRDRVVVLDSPQLPW